MEVSTKPLVKLDLGAGIKVNEGYITVGLEPHHDVITDLRKLPFEDNYADEAMAIHVFEHFYAWDVLHVLAEWKRVLKPGGLLVLELPDLYKCCLAFVRDKGLNARHSIWGIYGDPSYNDVFMLHKFGYTPESLKDILRASGFTKVKEKPVQFHKPSRDMRIEARKPK
jgi:predicted SAM-dependent methyltransferase